VPTVPKELHIQQAIDLRVDFRNALFPLREFGRVIDYLREAEILAKTIDDQRRLGLVSLHMSHYFRMMGEPDSALEFAHRAIAIAETLRDPRLHALAARRLGQVYHAVGNYPRAEDFLRTAALEGDRSREQLSQVGLPSVTSRFWWVYCSLEGTRTRSREAPRRCLRSFPSSGRVFRRPCGISPSSGQFPPSTRP